MFDTLAEHMEHEAAVFTFQNESQAAFDASRRERKPDDTGKIDGLVEAGRHVVFFTYPTYCPRTDALMGMATKLVSDHATLAEAEAALAPFLTEEDYTSDMQYGIMSKQERTVVAAPVDEDEVPF
jgi:hypothetical protein